MAEDVRICERLKSTRTHLRETQAGMAALMGISLRALQTYEAGDREPKAKDVARLARIGIDLNWLLTGEGEMLRGGAAEPSSPVDLDLLRDCIEVLREELRHRGRTLEPAQEAEAIALLYEIATPKPGQQPQPLERGVVVRLLKVVG